MSVAGAAAPAVDARPDSSPAGWYTLAILTLVTFYIYMDRQVFVLLAEPIARSMQLSDFQIGLLQGLGLAIFAALASIPIGALSDRFDRRLVLAGCLVIWCAAVVACGLSQDFTQLFIASAIVGIGEAGMTPIVYAWIPELFRNARRQAANSIYAISNRLGNGLALAVVGAVLLAVSQPDLSLPDGLAQMEPWRLTFLALALPGPLLLLLILTLRPSRAAAGTAPSIVSEAPATIGVMKHFRSHRITLASFYAAIGFAVFGLAAVGVWLPVFAMRRFGATPSDVGGLLGTITIVAAIVGLLFTIVGSHYLRVWLGERMPVLVMAFSCLAGAASLGLLFIATDARMLLVIYGIHLTLVVSGNMFYPTALQELAPAPIRGRMVAAMSIVLLAFSAVAPALVGLVSDWLKPRADGLLLAATGAAALGLVVAAGLMLLSSRGYVATKRAAEAHGA